MFKKKLLIYSVTIVSGLFISAKYAEWPVNIWCIGLFAYLFYQAERKERIEMIAVLAFATPLELFFSEVWLIYEYQRGLMPLFVPFGHWFVFDSGKIIAKYLASKRALIRPHEAFSELRGVVVIAERLPNIAPGSRLFPEYAESP